MTRGVVASWIGLVRRRWPWGAGVAAVVLALATALVLLSRPVHRAEARLRLGEAPPMPGLSSAGGLLGFLRSGGDPFANDLEVMASRTLAERVTADAVLNLVLVAPKGWYRDSLFMAERAGPMSTKASYLLTWEPGGAVTVARTAPTDSAVGRFAAGEPIRFADVELVPGPRKDGAPTEVTIKVVPWAEAVTLTQRRIKVERTRREANVVLVRFDEGDPAVALAGVAAAVAGFVDLRSRLLQRESGENSDSLRGVAARTRAELTATEDALSAFQRQSGLIAPEAQSEAAVTRLMDAQVELETARQDLAAIESMIARSESAPEAATAWTALVAHPRFLENETIGSLLTRLIALEEQRTVLASRRSDESLEYRTIVEQMRFLEGSLRAVTASYRTGLSERIAPLQEIVSRTQSQLASVPQQHVELVRMQRQTRLLSEVLLATEGRLREEELREALTFSNVQVIDEPELGYRPIWPRKKLGLAVGMVLALGFAVLAMVVVESADGTVRSASELSIISGAPVLAALTVNGRMVRPGASEATALLTLGGGPPAALPPLVVAAVDANGGAAMADEVRAVLASGGFEAPQREIRLAGPVVSYAAARDALAHGGPILLAVVRGRTSLPDVARAVRLLRDAGGGASGMVVVCRTDEEAGELWA